MYFIISQFNQLFHDSVTSFTPQIIMAKPAGGPKAPDGRKDFDEDD